MSLTFTDCAARLTPLRRWFANCCKQKEKAQKGGNRCCASWREGVAWAKQQPTQQAGSSFALLAGQGEQPASQKCQLLLAQEQQQLSNSKNSQQHHQEKSGELTALAGVGSCCCCLRLLLCAGCQWQGWRARAVMIDWLVAPLLPR